jgi:hypothetical protein
MIRGELIQITSDVPPTNGCQLEFTGTLPRTSTENVIAKVVSHPVGSGGLEQDESPRVAYRENCCVDQSADSGCGEDPYAPQIDWS